MSPAEVIKLWKSIEQEKQFKDALKESGFRYIGSGLESVVYAKPRSEFVVKVCDGRIATHKLKDPQLEKYRLGYIFTNRRKSVGIQMRVNRSNRYRAWAQIRDSVNTDLSEFDIHQQNVGWYKGKPVIIDYV